jgi:putative MATE family efflux protein
LSEAGRASRLEEYAARPRRALWTMAIPVMAGMSIHTFYMIADMVFVGWIGPDALAALAFNMPLIFLGLGVTFGLGTGVTALIAQAIGARDKVEADRAAEHALGVGLVVAGTFTGVAYLWGEPLLGALGVPGHLLGLAWEYFSVLAGGFVFLVLSVFFRSILSGEGDMKTPMMIGGVGTILNVILDPLFIFGLDMGVRGAAIATVLSQALVALVFVYLLFFKEHTYVTFDLRNFRPSGRIVAGIFKVGAPASFSFVVMAFGGAVFNRILVSFSEDAVAGYQVGVRLDHVVLLPLIAISASLVTLVGMFHGAQRSDLVRETLHYGVLCAAGIALGLGVLFFVLAPVLAGMFSESPEIRSIATGYLRITVIGYPCIAVSMPIGRALQGLGLGLPVLLLTLLRVLLVSAPLSLWFVHGLGWPVSSVWVAIVLGNAVAAVTALAWLRTGLARAKASSGAGAAAVTPAH